MASLLLALILLLAAHPIAAQPTVDAYALHFTDRAIRIDYFHTGRRGQEILALDGIVDDGAWPGSRSRLIDDTNLGKYLFEVVDPATNRPIYSRGFASIYGEWETTPEADRVARTFHESLRLPWPRHKVQVVLKKRDDDGSFHELWSVNVDPESRFVNRAPATPAGRVWPVFEHGPPSDKVDILIIGEGYTEAELTKFRADTVRLVGVLFEHEPFRSRKADFNVWALHLPSARSGVHRPRTRDDRRTPLSAEYNIFDSERYLLTFDNRALRNAAASAPYEFIEILVNEAQYGGGGIFNAQATASVDSAFSDYVFVHEFGHHFAGLGDEYYTSDVAYETGAPVHPEPWEPNITALHDPALLKWGDLVEAGTPVPTPWDKERFEERSRQIQARRRELRARKAPESEMDRLFREQQAAETALLGAMRYAGKVGAFEGAMYEAKGLYRPEADCIMFTRDKVGFCRVCRRAIERIIDLYARR